MRKILRAGAGNLGQMLKMQTSKMGLGLWLLLICWASQLSAWELNNFYFFRPRIQEVKIVSGSDSVCFSKTSKSLSIGDQPRLALVVELILGHSKIFISEVSVCDESGKKIPTLSWPDGWEVPEVEWFRVEPDARDIYYDNKRPVFHWDVISYLNTLMADNGNKWIIAADPDPTLLRVRLRHLGTMRYAVRVYWKGQTISSPGPEARFRGDIGSEVHRVSIYGETGNPIINYAFGRFNLPYIWGAGGTDDEDHQTNRFIGADCADFVTGVFRDLGVELPFSSVAAFYPRGIYRKKNFGRPITGVLEPDVSGIYRTQKGRAVRFGDDGDVKTGDILVFARHTAILYVDQSPSIGVLRGHSNGILDTSDLLIHTLYREPTIEKIGPAHPLTTFFVFRFNGDFGGQSLGMEEVESQFLPAAPEPRKIRTRR